MKYIPDPYFYSYDLLGCFRYVFHVHISLNLCFNTFITDLDIYIVETSFLTYSNLFLSIRFKTIKVYFLRIFPKVIEKGVC